MVSPCPCREVGRAGTRGRGGGRSLPHISPGTDVLLACPVPGQRVGRQVPEGDFLVESVDGYVPISEANQPWGLWQGDFSLEV